MDEKLLEIKAKMDAIMVPSPLPGETYGQLMERCDLAKVSREYQARIEEMGNLRFGKHVISHWEQSAA